MKFVKLELEDLSNNYIIGAYIKDSNNDKIVKVINYIEDDVLPIHWAILEKPYLNYGNKVDEDTLLRDFDIEDEPSWDIDELDIYD